MRLLARSALFAAALGTGLAAAAGAGAADRTIDVILPATGNASFVGQGVKTVLGVLETKTNREGGINGDRLSFAFHDDQTSPQTAVQLANTLIAKKPPVLMGSGIVAMCNAMMPLVRNGPFTYCLSPAAQPAAGSFMFSTNTSTRDLLAADMRYLKERGWTRIAMISSSDATGQDFEKGVDLALAAPDLAGLKIVERARFNQSDVSVAAQMERIRAAEPQVLITWTTGAPIATVFKGIIQADITIPVFTTNGNQTFQQMDQYAAFLPKELYIASSLFAPHDGIVTFDPRVEAAQKAFYADLKEAGVPVDVMASHAWDAGQMVIDALRKGGAEVTAETVRTYLAGLTDYVGVNGIYDFRKNPQRGLDVGSAIVTRWDAAKRNWLPVSEPGGVPLKKS